MKPVKVPPTIAAHLFTTDKPTAELTLPIPFALNQVAMNDWFSDLALHNLHLAFTDLIQALISLDNTQTNPRFLYAFFEKNRITAGPLLETIENQHLHSNFPLTSEIKQLVNDSIHFHESLASAYISLINCNEFGSPDNENLTAEDEQPLPAISQITVLYQALHSLGQVLLKSAQSYQRPPEGIWQKVNALYNLAVINDLAEQEITGPASMLKQTITITNLFKSIHFFNLSSSNRFNQREIKYIYKLLGESAMYISLSKGKAGQQADFFVNLNTNKPANYLEQSQPSSPDDWFFYSASFIEYISGSDVMSIVAGETIINLPNRPTRFPEHTIKRLLECWQHKPQRVFERSAANKNVTLYPSFQNIQKKLFKRNAHLPNNTNNSVKELEVTDFELVPINSHSTVGYSPNMRNEHIIEKLLIDSKNPDKRSDIQKKASQQKLEGDAHSFNCTIKNISATGYQLDIDQQTTAQLKAGDLIGLSLDDGPLEIAIIRRLLSLADGGLSAGVELIAPQAKIVKILNKNDNIRSRYLLMLPAIPAIEQSISILSPSLINLPDSLIALLVDDKKEFFSINKMLESNATFTHYTLEKTSSPNNAS